MVLLIPYLYLLLLQILLTGICVLVVFQKKKKIFLRNNEVSHAHGPYLICQITDKHLINTPAQTTDLRLWYSKKHSYQVPQNASSAPWRGKASPPPGSLFIVKHLNDNQITKFTQAGFLAQQRLARGVRLNRTEAVALIASQLQERIRDGQNSVAELMRDGKDMLGRRHVLPDVPSLLHDIQVEGTFPDGWVHLQQFITIQNLAAYKAL